MAYRFDEAAGGSEEGARGAASPLLQAAGALRRRAEERFEAERPRWFLWWVVLFGAGIGLYFHLEREPDLALALALPVGIAALRLASKRRYLLNIALGAALAMAGGFALAKARTEWVRAPVLERAMGPVEIRGVVELVEPRPGRGQRLTLRVTQLGDLEEDKRPVRARVRTMVGLDGLKAGDSVVMRARLSPPSAPSLPGDYDFARSAWFQRIGAVGYSLAAPTLEPSGPQEGSGLKPAIERLRARIGERVMAVLPGEKGAIATALLTGERGAIASDTTDAFRDSGLLHILSISGLHMAIMAGAVFLLVRVVLAAVPWIALNFPVKKWAAAAAMLAALGYLMISGSSVATIRSWLMTTIMLGAVLLDRPALALRNVALSALIILAVAPESLNDVGFQMSFAAVVSLIALHETIGLSPRNEGGQSVSRLRGVMLFFAGIVLTTLAASVAVAPFAAYHFHKSQQYAVIANVIAIPICNLIVMPAELAALVAMPFGLEKGPLMVMGWGIDAMSATARAVAALPGAVGHIPAMPASAFCLMVFGGLWLVLWRTRWRLLGIGLFAAGLAAAPFGSRPDLIAGRNGNLMALRGADGVLAVHAGRGSAFEAKRWLEHDGDRRSLDEVRTGAGLVCDALGCTGRLGTGVVALSRHPAGLRDDCREARVLVLPMPRPVWCTEPAMVIDVFHMMREGTHVIYAGAGGALRVETVNGWRGARPWVLRWRPREHKERRQRTRREQAEATVRARPGTREDGGSAAGIGAVGDDGAEPASGPVEE